MDLANASLTDLAKLQSSSNEWLIRHSRRLLQERLSEADGRVEEDTFFHLIQQCLKELEKRNKSRVFGIAQTLMMLSRRHRIDSNISLMEALRPVESNELVAFEVEDCFDTIVDRDLGRAKERLRKLMEPSAPREVRLKFASSLQRLHPKDRLEIVEWALQREEDRDDPEIPLLLWYAIQDVPEVDWAAALKLMMKTELPLAREFLARRIALMPVAENRDPAATLTQLALAHADEPIGRDILAGMQAAFKGRCDLPMPRDWDDASLVFRHSPIPEVRTRGAALGVHFGDPAAIAWTAKLVKNPRAELPRRRDALDSLVFKRPDSLRGLLIELLDDPDLRDTAIKGLAGFDDKAIPPRLLAHYPKLAPAERRDAIATLSARPAFALALLNAVAEKTIDRKDLGPVEVRQLLALKDAKVTARVEEVWGTLRPASAEKAALMAKYRKLLAPEQVKAADHVVGRQMFVKHCAACHKLFGEGGAIGPDITGSQRANLDYLLENILDPSAVVPKEYQVSVFTTTAGRTIVGLVKEETDSAVIVQTSNEAIILPKAEIDRRTASKQSMMPDGILEQMTIEEARALVSYLGRPTPLKK